MKEIAIFIFAGIFIFGEFISMSNAGGATISNVKAGRKNIIQSGIYDDSSDSSDESGNGGNRGTRYYKCNSGSCLNNPGQGSGNNPFESTGAIIRNVKAGRRNIIQSGIY